MRRISLLLALIAIAASWSAVAPAAAAGYTVTAYNYYWTPSSLSVAPGDSVTFELGAGYHTWVSDSGMGSCSLPCTKSFPAEGTFYYHCGVHPSMTASVTVGTPPSVSITDPADGATISGIYTVQGDASHATSDIQEVRVSLDGAASQPADLVGSGTSVGWTFDLDTRGATNGAHTITATATTVSGLTSATTITVSVDNPDTVDLEVLDLRSSNTWPNQRLRVTAFNGGNADAGAWTASAEYAHQGAWHPIGEVQVQGPAPHGAVLFEIAWNAGGVLVGNFPVRVTLDTTGAIDELDESNNERAGSAYFLHPGLPPTDLRDP